MVVVIDDDVVIGMMLSMALPGATIAEASRRGEGLALVRVTRPDAIIVDRRFPDGDGLELVRTLREEDGNQEVVIIVLTAGFDEAERPEVEAAGANAYLAKPIDPDELSRIIVSLIGDRPVIAREQPSVPMTAVTEELLPGERPIAPSRGATSSRRMPLRARPADPPPPVRKGSTFGSLPRWDAPPVLHELTDDDRLMSPSDLPIWGRSTTPEPPPPAPAASDAEEIDKLEALLDDARHDNARLLRQIDGLEAQLTEANAGGQRALTEREFLSGATEELRAAVARAEADAHLLREQLVEARASAAEVDQLRRELSAAYARIDALENVNTPAKAAPAKRVAKKSAKAEPAAKRVAKKTTKAGTPAKATPAKRVAKKAAQAPEDDPAPAPAPRRVRQLRPLKKREP
jgi:CheY-like chemotaxis protein